MKHFEEPPKKPTSFGIRHVQMICIFFCMIALLMARSSLGVAILAMTAVGNTNNDNIETYNWDKKTQGLILSSFFWGYMSMQIPAGILAKRFGGKPILLVALLLNGSLTAMFPTLASLGGWPLACAVRVAMGLSQACLYPASHTLLGRWLPTNERTAYTGVVYSGSQMGIIIAMPLCGYLSETALGWKMIFYVISVIMFVTAAMWYFFSASSPHEHPMISEVERDYIEMGLNSGEPRINYPAPWKEMLCSIPLWAVVSAHIGGAMTFILFFVDLPTYLERAMHISLKDSAALSALPYIGMSVGNIVSAILSEYLCNRGLLSVTISRKLFNSIGMFGAGLGTIVLAFLGPDNKAIVITTLIILMTVYGCTSSGFVVNILDLSPQFAGVMLSMTNFIGNLGGLFTPVITSFILKNDPSDVSRWRIVFFMITAIAVGSNLIYITFGSCDRQPWDNPHFKNRRKTNPEELKPLDEKKIEELETLNSSSNI